MSKKQRLWLYFIIIFSLIHIVRDIFQDLGIKNFLSTVLASPGSPKVSTLFYWTIFNTYAIATIAIVLSFICLLRNRFDIIGKATILIAVISFSLWSFYYFFLV